MVGNRFRHQGGDWRCKEVRQMTYRERSCVDKVKAVMQRSGSIRQPAEKFGAFAEIAAGKFGHLIGRNQGSDWQPKGRGIQDQTYAGETGRTIRRDMTKNGSDPLLNVHCSMFARTHFKEFRPTR